MQRIFAHRILYGNKEYKNHLAEIDSQGEVKFYPFEREVFGTIFVSGTIRIDIDGGELRYVSVPDEMGAECRGMEL